MKIAVFDELPTHRELLSFYIQDYCGRHMLRQQTLLYGNITDLLYSLPAENFDLVFLNVTEFSFHLLKSSRFIREARPRPLLVFTLLESDLFPSLLRTHAVAFLLKPFDAKEFSRIFEHCLKLLPAAEYFITVKESRQMIQIALHDILYTDNDNHYICIHTNERIIKTYMPFSQFWEMISAFHEFIQCYRNNAVNMLHIVRMTKDSCIMTNNEVIPISRSMRTQVHQAYQEYRQFR